MVLSTVINSYQHTGYVPLIPRLAMSDPVQEPCHEWRDTNVPQWGESVHDAQLPKTQAVDFLSLVPRHERCKVSSAASETSKQHGEGVITVKQYVIAVEQLDIEGAEQHSVRKCPVARAMKRQLPGQYRNAVAVSNCDVCVGTGECIDLPQEVRTRIHLFDRTGRMIPFTFVLII